MAKNLRFTAFAWHYCGCSKWGLWINCHTIWRSQPPYIRHFGSSYNTNLRNSHNTLLLFNESKNIVATAASTAATNLLKNAEVLLEPNPNSTEETYKITAIFENKTLIFENCKTKKT
jgi:hypothetical protein